MALKSVSPSVESYVFLKSTNEIYINKNSRVSNTVERFAKYVQNKEPQPWWKAIKRRKGGEDRGSDKEIIYKPVMYCIS